MSEFNRMRALTTLVLKNKMDTHAHIPFAEDDPDTRELIHLLLSQVGFRVSATGSPADVLTLAATERVTRRQTAVLVGAQGYVGKTFDPDDLIHALRAALSKS